MVIKLYLADTAETLNHCNSMRVFQQIPICSHIEPLLHVKFVTKTVFDSCQVCVKLNFAFVFSLRG